MAIISSLVYHLLLFPQPYFYTNEKIVIQSDSGKYFVFNLNNRTTQDFTGNVKELLPSKDLQNIHDMYIPKKTCYPY